jgi:hypothetical protein
MNKYQPEIDAVKHLRESFPSLPARGLAHILSDQCGDSCLFRNNHFSDQDYTAYARVSKCSYYSFYNRIRRVDGSIV